VRGRNCCDGICYFADLCLIVMVSACCFFITGVGHFLQYKASRRLLLGIKAASVHQQQGHLFRSTTPLRLKSSGSEYF
jgi:hypothetical protein